jgi:PIN domain nuclease of toxin-antitoxin system
VRLLLDSHALVWAATDDPRLSEPSREALTSRANEILVSAASAWEIATKVRLGRFPEAAALVAEFEVTVRSLGATELAVTAEHGLAAGGFNADHRDPFDRMLAAQAVIERAVLVTTDRAFRQFPVEVLW